MPKSSKARVLVVDDSPDVRAAMSELLSADGYSPDTAEDAESALAQIEERPPELILTDLCMPGVDGIELVKRTRAAHPEIPVIVVTASQDLARAVEAMRVGAEDYLTKPIDRVAVGLAIERALHRRELHREAEELRRELRERDHHGFEGLVGVSPAIQRVYRVAGQVAPSRATVLITGESGTGKGQVARAIHAKSPRADKPFVAVHCAALAESILESELFGHEKGSFTGAHRQRLGRFEQADGGTIFLDEVGELSPSMQVKLLRVLQERVFERVGGNDPITTDVRIIAATNRDLGKDVADGRFREDLFYRLNVIQISMPPLRTREADVLLLASHFLRRFARENGKRIDGFTERARAKLVAHEWPGNVRELENAIERAAVLCDQDLVDERHLPMGAAPGTTPSLRIPGMTLEELERYVILATVDSVGGSTTKAAEILGISVRTLQYRLQDYGLARTRRSTRTQRLRDVAPNHSHSGVGDKRTPDDGADDLVEETERHRG